MRIVAGTFGGRKLLGPAGRAARPTSDRVREALFSILGGVEGARVLDLFAGTGALALEAISRGAASAVLVERDRRMFEIARSNASALLGEDLAGATLLRCDALEYLTKPESDSFDLVFLDPPYARAGVLDPLLAGALPPVLAPGARVVAESDRRSPLALSDSALALISEHRYGDTLLRVFRAP